MTRLATVLAATLAVAPAAFLAIPRAAAAPATGALADEIMRAGAGPPSGGVRGYVAVPPEAFTSQAGPTSPLLYVNRCRGGCAFTKSSLSDAINNLTIIGGVSPGTRMTLSEFGYDDTVWQETIDCIKAVYAPFGVQVVTDDPGNTAHHEAVLAGHASEMNIVGALGIAPLDSSTCRAQNNVVSFSFANDHGARPLDMCWTVAQESAHAYGLDHEFECSDPMTYIPISACGGTKYFRNLDAPCGENAARQCLCGGSTQNSYQRLLAVHGAGTTPIAPPVTDIKMPLDGATGLPATFSVFATALDPRGVHNVELYVNGWKWNEVPGVWQKASPYTLNLPAGVPDGVMDLKVRGCGDSGVCSEDQITVTRGAPCTNATQCATGQKCEAGKCFWEAPTLQVGDTCQYAQQCVSTVCANVNGDQICTQDCVSGPNDSCPDGYECISPGLGQHGNCGVALTEDGGCCSTGDRGGRGLWMNVALGGVIGLIVAARRRRRR